MDFDVERTRRALLRIRVISSVYSQLAYEATRQFSSKANILSILGIVLSTLAGMVALVEDGVCETSVAVGLISILSSFLQALRTFLRYEEKTQLFSERRSEFASVNSAIDRANLEELTLEEYSVIAIEYENAVSKTPVFERGILENFVESNPEFIEEGSKLALLPEFLTEPIDYIGLFHDDMSATRTPPRNVLRLIPDQNNNRN